MFENGSGEVVEEWISISDIAKRIDIDHIDKLCGALDCTAGELFEYVPAQKTTDPK